MLVAIAYLVCAVVWGTTWFAIRQCIGADGFPTLTSAALRFTIAALTLHLIVTALRLRPRIATRRQRTWLGLAGLFNGSGYALVYIGEETVPGAFASILFGTLPLILAFLAGVTRTERVHLGHVLGAVVSLVGISTIVGDRVSVSASQGTGIALLCGAVVLSAIYSLILKRESKGVHPLCATSWFLTVTAIALWSVALVAEGPLTSWPRDAEPTLALLYLALVGSVLTFACYLFLLQRVSLMTTTTLVFVQPVIALFVDSQWEPDIVLTHKSYLGAAITLGGVLVATLWQRKKRRMA